MGHIPRMFELNDIEILQHEIVEHFSTLYMCIETLEESQELQTDMELFKTIKSTLFKIKYFDLFVPTSEFTLGLYPIVSKFSQEFEETLNNLQMVLPFRRTKMIRLNKLKNIYDEHFATVFKQFLDD